MYDHQLYVRTLSEFTRVLLTPYEVGAALGELTDRVTAVLGLAGSGVSLVQEDRLVLVTAFGADVAEVERTQARAQAGPCVTACETGTVVAVSDLSTRAQQWPDYCEAAARLGVMAVASLPLRLGETDRAVGVLDLYADGPRHWPDEDLAAAAVMADMATAYLVNASYHHKQVELAGQLQRALHSRVVIEQAKGVLVARHHLTAEEAFERLRRHARNRSLALTTVAQAVVRLELDL